MSPPSPAAAPDNDAAPPMHTIPIADRPRHGTWWNTLMFPLLFNLGILGISSAQVCAVPLLLVPFVGRRLFEGVVDWTKDGFGRLRESCAAMHRRRPPCRTRGTRINPGFDECEGAD